MSASLEMPLVSTLAVGLSCALIGGLIACKLRMPPVVGYLLAGVLIGPHTPGFVGDSKLAEQLSEIGIVLLMFGVGLHFSVKDLMRVRRIAIPGAIIQIVVATALGMGAALTWGWHLGESFILGLALSVASTVVLLRALEERDAIDTVNGHIAVGWLIVEDIVMVAALVLIPALAGGTSENNDWIVSLLITFAKLGGFILFMLVAGKRLLPWLLEMVVRTHSRELFTLSVVAVAIGVAYGSALLFDVSLALGAFFAGMMLKESDISKKAEAHSLPFQDAFSVLFFVAVGMLFDPLILLDQPFQVAVVVLVILVGKTLAAFFIVMLARYPLNTALMVSVSLAQIGEFSFILATLGRQHGLLSAEGQSLILAGALISITLNPFLFNLLERRDISLTDKG